MKLSADERDLLELLCANAARGAIFARLVRLKPAAPIGRLRMRGLVALDSYLPSESALAWWRSASNDPETSLPEARTAGEAEAPELPAASAPVPSDAVVRASSDGTFVDGEPESSAASEQRVTGEQLAAEIIAFCERVGVSRTAFCQFAGFNNPSNLVNQVYSAACPRKTTVDRVRAGFAKWSEAGATERAAPKARIAQALSATIDKEEVLRRKAEAQARDDQRRATARDVELRERQARAKTPDAPRAAEAVMLESGVPKPAWWSPQFQAQLDRITPETKVVNKPVIRRPEPGMTLGGVASGMLE